MDITKKTLNKLDYDMYDLTFKQVINFIKYEYFTYELPKELLIEKMYIYNKFLNNLFNNNDVLLYIKNQSEYNNYLIEYVNECINDINTEMLFIDYDLYYMYMFCYCLSNKKNSKNLNNNFTTKFKSYKDFTSLFC